MSKMNFGEWARDIRTVALMAWNKRAFVRIREAESVAAAKQDTINTRDEQVADLRADLEMYRAELQGEVRRKVNLESQVDKLESELRSSKYLIGCYSRIRIRQLERITELQRQLKNYEPVNLYDGLSIEQWRLRALNAEGVARHRFKEVLELERTVKIGNEFIELQTERLTNARNHVIRVRQACDELEPADSGASLDP